MNLRRQLLIVSLLTLLLPWAGCQFIRETETALRAGQQQMLAGTARAIAETLSTYPEEFPARAQGNQRASDQLYGHDLEAAPEIDGYFNDWPLERNSLRSMGGTDGPVRFVLGLHDGALYLYAEVADSEVVYAGPGTIAVDTTSRFADRVTLVSSSPPYRDDAIVFAAEAPGPIVSYVSSAFGFAPEPRIRAWWQDVPGGYQVEARIPLSLAGTHLGLVVTNTADAVRPGVRSSSFATPDPGAFTTVSAELERTAAMLVQADMRLIVTDRSGWRLAAVGDIRTNNQGQASIGSTWLSIGYDALVDAGEEAELAEPDPTGLETQSFITRALGGSEAVSWYRSRDDGRAVVAAAAPVSVAGDIAGAIVLQQGTDAILSLRNEGLARLVNVTLIATVLVAAALLGYATWLSRRIRRLSIAAEEALDRDELRRSLPSSLAGDEVGDLSRSFSNVLRQLADYNDYLRTLASKLSHELRTPLAIVTSSLENLEHEPLNEASLGYAARARDGADRLRRILSAMSEASRVEEIMAQAEPERFDLVAVLRPVIRAYDDVYADRDFAFSATPAAAMMRGSPELIIQMLDKLVDNAVDFSPTGATISVALDHGEAGLTLSVINPGPPLPEKMRSQLFDSMVSVRTRNDEHLGLGLYVARLIAEGHGGTISAANTDDGVSFSVVLPVLEVTAADEESIHD